MRDVNLTDLRLVADIGGTNTRMALACGGAIVAGTVSNFQNDTWKSLYPIIETFLERHKVQPSEMVIAVAGPVHQGQARLTNRSWVIEGTQIAAQFNCGKVHLLNDLNALAYAIPALVETQVREVRIGESQKMTIAQSLVVGVGTGFNVGPLLEKSGLIYCPAVEAGHVTLPLSIARELTRVGISLEGFETVETLFSGRGFTRFCQQLTGDDALEGRAVISSYGQSANDDVTAAVDLYAELLGRLLGELSMAYMPSSGIYLAGSVARAIMDVAQDACLKMIVKPDQIAPNFNPPVWVVEDDAAALIGCLGFEFT